MPAKLPEKLAKQYRVAYSLVLNKYWVDELYGAVIVLPLTLASRYLLGGVVETAGVNGAGKLTAAVTQGFGSLVARIQSGNIRSYAGWLAAGAAAVLLLVYFGFGAHAFMR